MSKAYILEKKRDGNLPGYETNMPVAMFLAKFRRIDKKVAGLLDYGYDELQVADELNIPLRQVQLIMAKHGYADIGRSAKRGEV